jgi:hypothetical protein
MFGFAPCLPRLRLPTLAMILILGGLVLAAPAARAQEQVLHYFPAGPIYDFRWKVLELALSHAQPGTPPHLAPLEEEVSQNRALRLLDAGGLDVIALGSNPEREALLLPVRIDILRGLVGLRLLLIRAADQDRIAAMDDATVRRQLTFGLNSQWADLPIMQAAGYKVATSTRHETLFEMLSSGRFDAFPRGTNEARQEIAQRQSIYPQLALEKTKALYFPYPIYFWVNKTNRALAETIERGLRLALQDGSFDQLFLSFHAADIAALSAEHRHVIRMDNPFLPPGTPAPDTRSWWPKSAVP